jgi:hypothetical protein
VGRVHLARRFFLAPIPVMPIWWNRAEPRGPRPMYETLYDFEVAEVRIPCDEGTLVPWWQLRTKFGVLKPAVYEPMIDWLRTYRVAPHFEVWFEPGIRPSTGAVGYLVVRFNDRQIAEHFQRTFGGRLL